MQGIRRRVPESEYDRDELGRQMAIMLYRVTKIETHTADDLRRLVESMPSEIRPGLSQRDSDKTIIAKCEAWERTRAGES
jgi:hypothetical protein